MGKNSKQRKKAASKQHAMDADEPQWQTGVSAETGEDLAGMDTTDFDQKLKVQHQPMKARQAKRGNRTRNQKLRKSGKLNKALAFAGRFESKTGKAGSAGKARKQAKGLWSKDQDAGPGVQ